MYRNIIIFTIYTIDNAVDMIDMYIHNKMNLWKEMGHFLNKAEMSNTSNLCNFDQI